MIPFQNSKVSNFPITVKSLRFTLFLLIILPVTYGNDNEGGMENMGVLVKQAAEPHTARLQLALVLDRTSHHYFYNKLPSVIQTMYQFLHWNFFGSEFALTSFHDYKDDDDRSLGAYDPSHPFWNANVRAKRVKQVIRKRKYNTSEHCYALETPFTRSIYNIEEAIRKMPVRPHTWGPEGHENSLQAVFFTAVDPKMGWWVNDTTSDGKQTQRFIILLTDNDVIVNNNELSSGGRTDPRADGTDNCLNSKLAEVQAISQVLQMKKIKLIVGVARTPLWSGINLLEKYTNMLEGMKVPHEIFEFDLGDSEQLTRDIVSRVTSLFAQEQESELQVTKTNETEIAIPSLD